MDPWQTNGWDWCTKTSYCWAHLLDWMLLAFLELWFLDFRSGGSAEQTEQTFTQAFSLMQHVESSHPPSFVMFKLQLYLDMWGGLLLGPFAKFCIVCTLSLRHIDQIKQVSLIRTSILVSNMSNLKAFTCRWCVACFHSSCSLLGVHW